ncbi:MAG: hypothetical protein ABF630_09520 [Liquorilactobacillus sp.]|jgi:hypothetical protein
MAYIGTVQDGTGTTVYPQTKKEGILDWPTDLANKSDITKVYEDQITAKNGQVIQFKRIGNIVIADFYGGSTAAVAAWTSLGKIPAGFSNGYYEINTVLENATQGKIIVVTFQTGTNDIITRDEGTVAAGSYFGQSVWFTKDSAPS